MHSRKSIFYKGIVFVASFLMMVLLTSIRAEAACSVTFVKNDNLVDSYDEQYVTLAGKIEHNNLWAHKCLPTILVERPPQEFPFKVDSM